MLRFSVKFLPSTQSPCCRKPSLSLNTAASDPVFACVLSSALLPILAMGEPLSSIVKGLSRLSMFASVGDDKSRVRLIVDRKTNARSNPINIRLELWLLANTWQDCLLVVARLARHFRRHMQQRRGSSTQPITMLISHLPSLVTIYNRGSSWAGTRVCCGRAGSC